MNIHRQIQAFALILFSLPAWLAQAEVSGIQVKSRETLADASAPFQYEVIRGVLSYTLNPDEPGNQRITDIGLAPRNADGLVEFSADFELYVPQGQNRSDVLLYSVNNRGGSTLPPEISLHYPLTQKGYTYLVTGWINELSPGGERVRLHAPVAGAAEAPVTGLVRYEIITNRADNKVNIAGNNHLAYIPSERGLSEVTLTRRVNQLDPRQSIPREQFKLALMPVADSNQVMVNLELAGGLEPGVIYELIYEAKDPVLSGAGLAGIRDMVALLRHGSDDPALQAQLSALDVPVIKHSIAWGISQSGRLLRQFLHQGFNADLAGRPVFDGMVPIIAGGGFGMFNTRFAMPTRTNGQHENLLYPNDYFPFTYGDSTDPYSGRRDGILHQSRASNTEPRVMHIQTANEYWVRAGSLPHTNPLGTEDAEVPENVRFYTIGGSQHGSGNGIPNSSPGLGQLPGNHNMWTPIADSLLLAMVDWVREDRSPPASRYPRIAEGTLVASHLDSGAINPEAWQPLPGYQHPKAMYQVGAASFGERFHDEGIIDHHPMSTDDWYVAKVPRVNRDNNDLAQSTILPPLTAVPLGSFVSWNLRNPQVGAETELARLSGGYIPFAKTPADAAANRDPRPALSERYASAAEYLASYEAATDALIAEGYLLPVFKDIYMDVGRQNAQILAESASTAP
ncbi:MAG: alpha/beta hydrolase domain-containing protein [Pseudomonadales bacterium]|nr:alpha/beta hydrolase domain-containing protein [Pseudomonadales bacterium]